ncbi:MAG: repressor LexA [Firmicutes bacterium]|nr:repressor LexA [Bacillota bacterium]
MRSKSPELMERISRYIGDYYRQHHTTPTTREIATAVGISPASGYNYLVEMDKRGLLSYENGVITDLPKINKTKNGYFSAPLVGSIRCGDPETEEEQVEMYVSLPEAIFGTGQFYLLRAKGDSMVDAGIAEEDLLVIQIQQEANEGDIVVALDPDGQNTLKRFGGYEEVSGCYRLEYMNEKRYPGKVERVHSFAVQGVVRHVIRTF